MTNKKDPKYILNVNANSQLNKIAEETMKAMSQNQSTAQIGNLNSGKAVMPKAPHVSEEEFRSTYKKLPPGLGKLTHPQ